jgi:transposase
VLDVEDWAEIRRLHRAERVPIKEIARVLGISKNTVRAALRSQSPPSYERSSTPLLVDPFEPRIRELLGAVPRMPATVIAERIGWPHSMRTLSNRVAQL